MKDTIYREDAIKAFKPLPTIEGLGLQPLITVDDAIKILNGLPSAQPEPQWIPCSERPPEVENNVAKRVLVTTSWTMVCEAHYCVDHWEMNDIDYKLSSVIAWMPLPEPYKENEDGTGSI